MNLRKLWDNVCSFLPAAAWYAVIFCFSAQTGSSSSALSDGLLHRLLERFWPAFFHQSEAERAALADFLTFLLRKGAPMGIYVVLAGLLLWAVRRQPSPRRRVLTVLPLCALLAGLDEFHQTFVPGREGRLRDVLIDLAGAALFLLLWALLRRLQAWRKRR